MQPDPAQAGAEVRSGAAVARTVRPESTNKVRRTKAVFSTRLAEWATLNASAVADRNSVARHGGMFDPELIIGGSSVAPLRRHEAQ